METTRLQLNPVTNKAKLEIVSTVEIKVVLDEEKLLRKKEILEGGIAKFQTELDQVNIDLTRIYNAKL